MPYQVSLLRVLQRVQFTPTKRVILTIKIRKYLDKLLLKKSSYIKFLVFLFRFFYCNLEPLYYYQQFIFYKAI